MYSREILLRH
jgi:hypothetical protein